MSDINGGAGYPNANGSSIFPGTQFQGPITAGNVVHSDGSGTLAGLGGSNGTANTGYVVMAQTAKVTQAASAGAGAGVYVTDIVLPAQSQIIEIFLLVTTAWDGSSPNVGIGTTITAAAITAAGQITGANAIGQLQTASPGTDATRTAFWNNVGTTDIQIQLTSANTGNGVGKLTVQYIQGINNPV